MKKLYVSAWDVLDLLRGHVDFWSFEANFLCHFCIFDLLSTDYFNRGFFLFQKTDDSSLLTRAE